MSFGQLVLGGKYMVANFFIDLECFAQGQIFRLNPFLTRLLIEHTSEGPSLIYIWNANT